MKDLHLEGIKSWPPPISDHSCNFWNLLSLYCFGRGDALQQSMLWELQFMLQFIGIPYMYQESKNNIFFSLLTLLCLFSYHLHTCWSHLKHNPKTPFQWFIICGLKVHCSHFKKLAFPSGSKTSQAKVKFICDMPYCILPGSTIWKASCENEKDDKFWFCSGMKIVHYSALGIGLYLEC